MNVAMTAHSAAGRTIILQAPSLDEGRTKAAQHLAVPPEEVTLRVRSHRKRSRLGAWFFGSSRELLEIEASWLPPPVPRPAPASGPTRTELPAASAVPGTPGQITLSVERGAVSLTVSPPQGNGRPADAAMLEAMIAGWPLTVRDDAVIAEALRAQDGQSRQFAAITPIIVVNDHAPATVVVARNEFIAWLVPWAPVPVEPQAVQAALEAAGVTAGIDEARLKTPIGTPLRLPTVIARGKPAHNGIDGQIVWLVDVPSKNISVPGSQGHRTSSAPRAASGAGASAGGRTGNRTAAVGGRRWPDLRGWSGLPFVDAGRPLLRKVPLVPEEAGFSVRGMAFSARPAKDVDIEPYVGPGTRLNDDGTVVIAEISGIVYLDGDQQRLTVLPIQAIAADMDTATGDVDFDGDVVVAGSVKPGLRIRATGNVEIGGSLEAASVDAGGDVIVAAGILGRPSAVIRAGGAVVAQSVHAAEIHAAGPVSITNEVRDSTIISEKSVTVHGRGHIIGGQVRGREFVDAKVLGASGSGRTWVQVGWGESVAAVIIAGPPGASPRIVVRERVQAGVVMTVGAHTHWFVEPSPGGVWRDGVNGLQRYLA